MEARRQFAEPVGAWFTQIGGLHTVFHIWHYPSLKERKETRDAAWQVATWSQTVSETVKLIVRRDVRYDVDGDVLEPQLTKSSSPPFPLSSL